MYKEKKKSKELDVMKNSKGNILVVDDEKSMREILQIFLKNEGYSISLANNGKSATEAVKKDIFDLVITDMNMPKVDGMELLKNIKEIAPDTGVDSAHFWQSLADIHAALGPGNRVLMEKRDQLQQQIDDWHKSHFGKLDLEVATVGAGPFQITALGRQLDFLAIFPAQSQGFLNDQMLTGFSSLNCMFFMLIRIAANGNHIKVRIVQHSIQVCVCLD